MDPIRKCVSLGGESVLESDSDPHDYRLYGNREFIIDSNTRWVKLWISWAQMQQHYTAAPTSAMDSWNRLSTDLVSARKLARLDEIVKKINSDSAMLESQGRGRIACFLTLGGNPTWAAAPATDDETYRYGRNYDTKWPDNRTTDGPWAWFLSYLMLRYIAPPKPPGNSLGAWINGIEIINEANHLWWPQNLSGCCVVDLMKTAENLAAFWGWGQTGQALFAPGTLDSPDPGYTTASNRRFTDYWTFTDGVLAALANWYPRVYVGWSHHNYRDIAQRQIGRVADVDNLLHNRNWRGGGDRYVWLTEGGYDMASTCVSPCQPPNYVVNPGERDKQRDLIRDNFNWMRVFTDVPMFTQHAIHDASWQDFKSAIRENFDYGTATPGAPRPAWGMWRNELPGAPNP
jgi:hypothetical protein